MKDSYSSTKQPQQTMDESPDSAEDDRAGFLSEHNEAACQVSVRMQRYLDEKVVALAEKMLELGRIEAEKSLSDHASLLHERCKAMQQEALAKGMNEGIKVGRCEGAFEGGQETLALMVERMLLHGFRPVSIASITGVSLSYVHHMVAQCKDKIN